MRRETDWLLPSAILTFGLGAVAMSGISPIKGDPDIWLPIWSWLAFGVVFLILWSAVYLVTLGARGEREPIHAFFVRAAALGPRWPAILLGIMLAGLDLYFFMWIKPQLNALRPFWADPYLAGLGKLLFGVDSWRLVTFMLQEWVAVAYTPVWFVALIATLYYVLLQPPSERRSRVLITYFLLWSVFGPVGQYFFSAGGPIFYRRIYGLGRYDELTAQLPAVARLASGYLWEAYQRKLLVYGAGISAMPSLHDASVTWAVIAFHREGWPLRILSYAFALFILVASVALGWHFSADGIVAIAGTLLCYALSAPIRRAAARLGTKETA
ncbi:phosphatase PAP2 family protein [Sphingomonas sp. ASV193]|uniref:phosphatase PAP2 family protein n=1 Tax=Sphingomonas sp. ASV193 TaxID=3144405 RepID=UPI0032E8C77E